MVPTNNNLVCIVRIRLIILQGRCAALHINSNIIWLYACISYKLTHLSSDLVIKNSLDVIYKLNLVHVTVQYNHDSAVF